MNSSHTQKGFTLVELIVAIGVFTFVAVMALGALLMIEGANRRSQATRAIVDSVGFILEDISRTAQSGSRYGCGGAQCEGVSGDDTFSFSTSDGTSVEYSFNAGKVMKKVGNTTQSITPPGVRIDNLTFYVSGNTINDSLTPKVLIVMGATIDKGGRYEKSINLQTTVTQRAVEE